MTRPDCSRVFGSDHALRVHRGRYHRRADALPGRAQIAPSKPLEGLPWIKMPTTSESCRVAAERVSGLIAYTWREDEQTFWATLHAHLIAVGAQLEKREHDEIVGSVPMGDRLKL